MWYVRNDALFHHGIKDMKWGIRRYQNADGTLTEAGKERLARERKENAARKKDNRMGEDAVNDPSRWVRDDTSRTKETVESARKLVNETDSFIQSTGKKRSVRVNTSQLTDKEMRDAIARWSLEKQYQDMYASRHPQKVSKGKQFTEKALKGAGSALAVAGSALTVALAWQQLTGGKPVIRNAFEKGKDVAQRVIKRGGES